MTKAIRSETPVRSTRAAARGVAPRSQKSRSAAAPDKAARPSAGGTSEDTSLSVDEIYDKLLTAIYEHRLAPGTKLVEDKLVSIFGTNRSRVRQAIARLANELVVTLQPNRGAYVAEPTVDEARDVFEARRAIEPGLVRRLIAVLDADKVDRLKRHVVAETKARADGDQRAMIRLSGVFHVLIAEMAGNSVLLPVIQKLISLSDIIIYLYDTSEVSSCRDDEHQEIVSAIAARDEARAVRLMLRHLDHVEQSLSLERSAGRSRELDAAFA